MISFKKKFAYISLLFSTLSLSILLGCGSKNTDNQINPSGGASTIPGAPEKFKNPEGYMTVEIDGKPVEMGISMSNSQLRADEAGNNYGYSIYGSLGGTEDVKSISIGLATKDDKTPINSLLGVHKSSEVINGYKNTVGITYSVFNSSKRSTLSWRSDDACTVEITSTTSPWIEGTFTIDNVVKSQSGQSSITIKKGMFKIRYKK